MAFVYWIHAAHHTDMFSEGYVGITSKDVKTRFIQHKSDAKLAKNTRPIGHAIRKYGDELKVTTVLEASLEYCQYVEKSLRSETSVGWNLAIGGDSPRLGSKASDESRAKMAASQTGRKHSEETKQKIGAKSKLYVPTEETRTKISKANKGRKVSEETRAKLVKAGEGRALSEETMAKLRPHWDTKTFGQKAKDAALVYLKSLHSWEVHSAKGNKHVWLMAAEMFSYCKSLPKVGAKRLAKKFGLKEANVMGILKKINNGWIPEDDNAWVAFKKQNKEATNVT